MGEARQMICPHHILDYEYGVWSRCRDCGQWISTRWPIGTSDAMGSGAFRFYVFPPAHVAHATHVPAAKHDTQALL